MSVFNFFVVLLMDILGHTKLQLVDDSLSLLTWGNDLCMYSCDLSSDLIMPSMLLWFKLWCDHWSSTLLFVLSKTGHIIGTENWEVNHGKLRSVILFCIFNVCSPFVMTDLHFSCLIYVFNVSFAFLNVHFALLMTDLLL